LVAFTVVISHLSTNYGVCNEKKVWGSGTQVTTDASGTNGTKTGQLEEPQPTPISLSALKAEGVLVSTVIGAGKTRVSCSWDVPLAQCFGFTAPW